MLTACVPALGEEVVAAAGEAPASEVAAFELGGWEETDAPVAELASFELTDPEGGTDTDPSPAPSGLEFHAEEAVLRLGCAYPLTMLFSTADGSPLDPAALQVALGDAEVIRLDGAGNVLGVQVGSTTISASLPEGGFAGGVVTVVDPESVGVTYVGDMPAKVYDGTAAFELDPADFLPDDDTQLAGLRVQEVQATADSASAGQRRLIAEVVLGGDSASLRSMTLALEAEILPRPIGEIAPQAPFEGRTFTYTGLPLRPEIELSMGDIPLERDVDYQVTYVDDLLPGQGTVTLTGIGSFTGQVEYPFEILPADLSLPEIQAGLEGVRGGTFPYGGEPVCPGFTLTYNGLELVPDRDYRATWADNDAPGEAILTLEGMGCFTGKVEVPYTISADILAASGALPAKLEIGVGEKVSLSFPAGAEFATSNKKIVAVSDSGVVKGVKNGSAKIAMRVSGKVSTCAVTVKAAPTKAALSSTKLTLNVGDSKTLKAKFSPSKCRAVYAWASSDESVAGVKDGVVKALKPGKATISVRTYNGKVGKCAVTVRAEPESVALNRAEYALYPKGTLKLKASLSPSGASTTLKWASSDPTVAKVSTAGKVTAKQAGQAVIRVTTANGLYADCTITVNPLPTKVTLDRTAATLGKGMTLQLTALVDVGSPDCLAWSSGDKSVASVSATGLVKAKKAGKATITAKAPNGKKATCKITMKALPKSVTVKAASSSLWVGETTQAAVKLTKGSYSPIEWSVEGDAVTVDQTGLITAVKPGTATVLATATAAFIAGSCTITVKSTDDSAPVTPVPPSGNGGSLIIDISKWQGSIDFSKVKSSVALVIARAACSTSKDVMFESYATDMNARGIPFGVYVYSHASTAETARAEARYLYKVAKGYGPRFYVIDAEESDITQSALKAFVDEMRSLGVAKVGAYVGHHRYTQYRFDQIKGLYDFVWIPRYGSNTGSVSGATLPAYPCDLWQYSSNGKVSGISGRVDLNVITGQGKSLGWFIA